VVNTGTSLELLSDTQITNPKTQGQVISWDGALSRWVNNGVSVTGYTNEALRLRTVSDSAQYSGTVTT
jgi:hypothetical protein